MISKFELHGKIIEETNVCAIYFHDFHEILS